MKRGIRGIFENKTFKRFPKCGYIALENGTPSCLLPLLLTWFNFNPSMDK